MHSHQLEQSWIVLNCNLMHLLFWKVSSQKNKKITVFRLFAWSKVVFWRRINSNSRKLWCGFQEVMLQFSSKTVLKRNSKITKYLLYFWWAKKAEYFMKSARKHQYHSRSLDCLTYQTKKQNRLPFSNKKRQNSSTKLCFSVNPSTWLYLN